MSGKQCRPGETLVVPDDALNVDMSLMIFAASEDSDQPVHSHNWTSLHGLPEEPLHHWLSVWRLAKTDQTARMSLRAYIIRYTFHGQPELTAWVYCCKTGEECATAHLTCFLYQFQLHLRRQRNPRTSLLEAKKSLFSNKRPADDDSDDVIPSVKRQRDNDSRVEDFSLVSRHLLEQHLRHPANAQRRNNVVSTSPRQHAAKCAASDQHVHSCSPISIFGFHKIHWAARRPWSDYEGCAGPHLYFQLSIQ